MLTGLMAERNTCMRAKAHFFTPCQYAKGEDAKRGTRRGGGCEGGLTGWLTLAWRRRQPMTVACMVATERSTLVLLTEGTAWRCARATKYSWIVRMALMYFTYRFLLGSSAMYLARTCKAPFP